MVVPSTTSTSSPVTTFVVEQLFTGLKVAIRESVDVLMGAVTKQTPETLDDIPNVAYKLL